MKLFSWLYFISMVILTIVFVYGAILLDNVVKDVNNRKNIFPILIYTNLEQTLDEISQYLQVNPVCDTYQIVSPDTLETILIQKYNLTDYKEIAGDYRLPYQIEVTVVPLSMNELARFVADLFTTFSDSIIHYNAKLWEDVDIQVNKLRFYFYILKIVFLCLYIGILYGIRLSYIHRHQSTISAIQTSGIPRLKLLKIDLQKNLSFWGLAIATAIIVDFAIRYLHLDQYVFSSNVYLLPITTVKQFIFSYFDIDLLVMLAITNLLLITVQKPMFKKSN